MGRNRKTVHLVPGLIKMARVNYDTEYYCKHCGHKDKLENSKRTSNGKMTCIECGRLVKRNPRDKVSTVQKQRTEKQKTIDTFLLLYLIKIYNEDEPKYPLTMERLQCLVFLAQKMGAPFSFDDWVFD